MVRKPTSQSVTAEPCGCGYLQRASEEPDIPIVFDEETNEYRVSHSADGGWSIIYHCPWCGGCAPGSKRASFFATITREESDRLQQLTGKLRTIEEAVATLGEPDEDDPRGTTIKTPETDTEPPHVATFRTLLFRGVSKTVDVELIDYGPTGIRFGFRGKPLDPAKHSTPDRS